MNRVALEWRRAGPSGRRAVAVRQPGLPALVAALWWALLGLCPVFPAWAQANAAAEPAPAASAPALLRYGVLASFPPYQVWPEGAPPGGADVDLVRELARAADLGLETRLYLI